MTNEQDTNNPKKCAPDVEWVREPRDDDKQGPTKLSWRTSFAATEVGNYSSACGHRSVHAGINLMRNYGQHNALLCGIRTARAAVIFTMDDDLQHQPEEIPRLLAREGFKIVYAAPDSEQHGFWRTIAFRVTRLALLSAGALKSRDI